MPLVASDAGYAGRTVDDLLLRFDILSRPGLRHGVTGRTPEMPLQGNLSFLVGSPAPDDIVANRQSWLHAIPVALDRLVCARQVHGCAVAIVDEPDAGRGALRVDNALTGVDALITATLDLPLMVLSADCVPILLYDPVRRVAGAVHAGWRGTVLDVAGGTVRAMQSSFGCDPAHVLVGLGPSIGPCCYEVGPEVIRAWDESGLDPRRSAILEHDSHAVLDLWAANELALTKAGIPRENIERSAICTRCQAERYFSRRADHGVRGLFGAIIALDSESERGVEGAR